MNPDASLAPDGFGPALYRSYWHTIKHIMILFFTNFHDHQANLERFNRAFMILPPQIGQPDLPWHIPDYFPIELHPRGYVQVTDS